MTKTAKRNTIITVVVVVAIVTVVALWAFAPWKAFTNKTVEEALPSASATPAPTNSDGIPQPTGPVTLSAGTFQSYEHTTTGTAKVVRVNDTSNVVRLENFKTSDGPDVRVWLSAKPANKADGANNAKYVDLGALKGNIGNQNYAIPAGTNLSDYQSVIIWCRRFTVPFGAAQLKAQDVHILNQQSQQSQNGQTQ